MTEMDTPRVVAVTRGIEDTGSQGPVRGPQHERLNVWVGRWINQGQMVLADGAPGMTITTSDVYEWLPGGFFIMHTAYGRIGDFGVGGAEIIGYDEASGGYQSHFYDSQGNVTAHRLNVRGDVWTYQGETTRSTVKFSDGNRIQTVLHERTDDGKNYAASMKVTLTKVE